jgi:ADP-L-glycero-D-manno-heptose 6-epimerase
MFLITGGAGFIGSNLVLKLQKLYPNSKIIVIDNYNSSKFKNLIDFKGEVYSCDITNKQHLNEILYGKKFRAVFHLGACTDTTVIDEKIQLNNNVQGTKNLLDLVDTENFIFASSASVYGITDKRCQESDDLKPANAYAFSKMIMENLIRGYKSKFKNLIGFRFFNVYGSNEEFKNKSASMVYQLLQQVNKNNKAKLFKYGEQKRDFIYVKDVVDCLIHSLDQYKEYEVYNLGTGKAVDFNTIINTINEVLNKKSKIEYIDCPYDFFQPFTEADTCKLNIDLKYNIKYNLKEGILDIFNEINKDKRTT